jgi:hypothetical protein
MSSTVAPERQHSAGLDLVSSLTEMLAAQVHRWSEECQWFLEWQREQVFAAEPTRELRSRHEVELKWLLAVGRMLNAATSDPDFMDRRASDLVKARMSQLQQSWEVSHPSMSADEAEAFLTKHFQPAHG